MIQTTIRILLVEDHQIVREGLRALLSREEDFVVVAEAVDGRAAVELAARHHPDVVIMDVAMPEMNGMDATRQIAAKTPGVRVIALTMHAENPYLMGMLEAGAVGYVLKDCAAEELLSAVRMVASGKGYFSPVVAAKIARHFSQADTSGSLPAVAVLTDKETNVLQLVTQGLSTKEIAVRLGVSVKTVEATRTQIMRKLDLHSIAELTKYALKTGLTSLEV